MLSAITDPHASIILSFPSILVIIIFGQVWFNESKLPQEIFFPQPTRKEESRRAKVIYYMDINIPSPSIGPPPSTAVPPRLSGDGGRTNEAFRGCLIILLTYRSDQQRLACRPSAAAAARLTEDMSMCSSGSSSFMDME